MANVDCCIMCGGYVPEGRQVCRECENKSLYRTKIYDEICSTLTDYENNEDPETTDEDWVEVFYMLLVKIQNAIECSDF